MGFILFVIIAIFLSWQWAKYEIAWRRDLTEFLREKKKKSRY